MKDTCPRWYPAIWLLVVPGSLLLIGLTRPAWLLRLTAYVLNLEWVGV